MAWEIVWTSRAIRDLRRLDRSVREAVVEAVGRYSASERGDVRRLVLPLQGFRLRYRDWRIAFECDDETGTLTVEWVRHRREAYKQQ